MTYGTYRVADANGEVTPDPILERGLTEALQRANRTVIRHVDDGKPLSAKTKEILLRSRLERAACYYGVRVK